MTKKAKRKPMARKKPVPELERLDHKARRQELVSVATHGMLDYVEQQILYDSDDDAREVPNWVVRSIIALARNAPRTRGRQPASYKKDRADMHLKMQVKKRARQLMADAKASGKVLSRTRAVPEAAEEFATARGVTVDTLVDLVTRRHKRKRKTKFPGAK